MYNTDILDLIAQERGVDEYGDPVITETRRTVFCEVISIGQKEFYEAQAVGLQPEKKFILADYLDYSGELFIEHSGVRYRVLRTYRKDVNLEITCTRGVDK